MIIDNKNHLKIILKIVLIHLAVNLVLLINNHLFYLILNYALCGPGTWPGTITDSELPAKMEIDWVKVSQPTGR